MVIVKQQSTQETELSFVRIRPDLASLGIAVPVGNTYRSFGYKQQIPSREFKDQLQIQLPDGKWHKVNPDDFISY